MPVVGLVGASLMVIPFLLVLRHGGSDLDHYPFVEEETTSRGRVPPGANVYAEIKGEAVVGELEEEQKTEEVASLRRMRLERSSWGQRAEGPSKAANE